MKTFMLFIFAVFALTSCDDIQDNSPALQVELDGELYRAIDARAEILPNGNLVMQGLTDVENLTITLSGSSEGVYTLGATGVNRAAFQDFLGSIYTTRPFGDGQVVIESTANNTFTGTFKFDAYRFGLDTLNAQKGFFFKVPIIAGSTSDEPDPPANFLSATIDGTNFEAETTTASEANDLITINGSKDNQSISLSFPSALTGGNNPIGEMINASYTLDGVTLQAASGNISIVNHDTTLNEISGAFSFLTGGTEGVEVTQGQFSVSY
ncbi:MAG: DUF6252 family protein [Flavobacteriaceae bacterium]